MSNADYSYEQCGDHEEFAKNRRSPDQRISIIERILAVLSAIIRRSGVRFLYLSKPHGRQVSDDPNRIDEPSVLDLPEDRIGRAFARESAVNDDQHPFIVQYTRVAKLVNPGL